jgi:hypothetical protein
MVTWKNVRLTIPGFLGYCLEVPFLHSNTSYIEGHLAVQRSNNRTTAPLTYTTGVAVTNARAARIATRNTSQYDHKNQDIIEHSSILGINEAKIADRQREQSIKKWKDDLKIKIKKST